MAAYYAHLKQGTEPRFSYEERDKAAGIIGKITPTSTPIADAADLEAIKIKALAYLGHEPDAFIYVTDADNRVYETLINHKYHEALARAWNQLAVTASLLALCVTTLVAGLLNEPPYLGAGCLGAVTILYVLLVKTEFLNEIEAAILCETLLALMLILVPIIVLAHRGH